MLRAQKTRLFAPAASISVIGEPVSHSEASSRRHQCPPPPCSCTRITVLASSAKIITGQSVARRRYSAVVSTSLSHCRLFRGPTGVRWGTSRASMLPDTAAGSVARQVRGRHLFESGYRQSFFVFFLLRFARCVWQRPAFLCFSTAAVRVLSLPLQAATHRLGGLSNLR